MNVWTVLLACSRPETTTVPPPGAEDTGTPPAPPHSGPETSAAHTGATGSTASTGATTTADTGAPPVDCAVLPPPPATGTAEAGWGQAEDFDFDLLGNHVAVNDGVLRLRDRSGGSSIAAAGFDGGAAGTRVLATGDFVVSDLGIGAVVRVDRATGARTPILSGLAYPNGLEVDRGGQVYVTDLGAGRVVQVDATTGASSEIARDLFTPNGLVLSPDELTLYVGSYAGCLVWAIDRPTPTTWSAPRVFFEHPGKAPCGGFDGITVDACGNLYVTESSVADVWRVTPDGAQVDRIADLPAGWVPNLRWGSGFGGWETDRLYVADRSFGRLYVLDVGLPGKRHVGLP